MINFTRWQTKEVSINAKTVAATSIHFTENGGQRFCPVFATFALTAASSLTVGPTVSIGTNASSYNNIFPATALTALTAANNMLNAILLEAVGSSVAANTDIQVNLSVAATGTSGTLLVTLHGFYR